ncbi:MAG: NAD-dependent epimerase/dehydratase family protein, partial [Ignavibacteria bacterium]|nr:NAD-dependent epimerase/dehydratase family protein [Ignavibacteria bacterium]
MSIKIILTGATGMVGEGVLMECLADPRVEKVLAVGRRPSGRVHPKLEELIASDLAAISPADKLSGYDACFFCAGVSSVGKKEAEYTVLTYDLTV